MSVKDINILFRNNTGNKEKTSLIEGFVVRTKPFETILKEISKIGSDKPEQSYLIIGQRGSGKTTLLYRLKYAIEDNNILSNYIFPVMLSEEQYSLTELSDLWEKIGDELDELEIFKGIKKSIESIINNEYYEEKAFTIIEQALIKSKKKIIVFLENLDVLFKKIGMDGQRRLREVLISSNYFRLVASSTSYFDAVTDYDKPFYDFFKIIELKGLSKKDCEKLLLKIGDQYGKRDEIEFIINNTPQRIESLRRLTGGIPRTISYLFQIFLDNENGKSLKDLYQLIDNLTFLYKAELDQLSPQQQKIVDVIARNWDAIAVKDIALKTRLESKQVSSILNTLEKSQFIETVPTKTKNNLYRIKERFLNIWYLMRFGKKQEKENVVWLVRFYDTWCDKTELAQHIDKHITNLTEGNYDVKAAIDMGNMFLACENVPNDLKYRVYSKTKAVIPRNFIKELKISDELLYNRINNLVKNKQNKQALEELSLIESRDDKYYAFTSWFYSRIERYDQSEDALINLFRLAPSGIIAFRIGYLNEYHLSNESKSIEYYKIALEHKEYSAALRLGDIYFRKDFLDEAIHYYHVALENEKNEAALSLSRSYFVSNELSKSEEYGKLAVEKGIFEGYETLGLTYQRKKQFKKAEVAFLKNLEKGNKLALIHLGIVNTKKKIPNYDIAADFFTQAINSKLYEGHYFLGSLLLNNPEKEKEGIYHLKMAIKKGSSRAAHSLGHYYQEKGDYPNSDSMFLKSFKLGRKTAIFCLVNSIYNERRKNEKSYALKVLEDHLDSLSEFSPMSNIEHAFLLLWNGDIDKSIKVFLNQFAKIHELIQKTDESDLKELVSSLTNFFILLIAKGQYNAAHSLFALEETIDLKQIIRPVYFALMNFMKEDFPREYLKAGDELKDTITEIVDFIGKTREDFI